MIIAGIVVVVVVVVIAGILVLVMKSIGKTSSPSKRGGQGQNENAYTKKHENIGKVADSLLIYKTYDYFIPLFNKCFFETLTLS